MLMLKLLALVPRPLIFVTSSVMKLPQMPLLVGLPTSIRYTLKEPLCVHWEFVRGYLIFGLLSD